MDSKQYDPRAKEAQLRAESESWDTTQIDSAQEGDIPIIDVEPYFRTDHNRELDQLAEQLLYASTEVGFYFLAGHGISAELLDRAFAASRRFHELPLAQKEWLRMDRPGWPFGGVGYLPFQNRKLPTRKKANANEAFIVKHQPGPKPVTFADNQWPGEELLPGFRKDVLAYGRALERLAIRLLPGYARALGLPADFFAEAFSAPMYRLRMTKYPPVPAYQRDEFGIAPHVDTTFITILAQDQEGLIIYNEKRGHWMRVPVVKGALIVNTGELLRQWTNDYFISVKHFANNNFSESPRYSIPFFFNANADYRMHCIPTCCSDDNPAKYPPFSYLESQAGIQGE